MTQHPFVRRSRRQLLGSIPALLLVLPGAAFAQSSDITSAGRTAVTNDQRTQSAPIQGTLSNPPATIDAATLSAAQARLAGNSISAKAQANDANSTLVGDFAADLPWPARVEIEDDGVSAEAAALIASRQSMRGTHVSVDAPSAGYALAIGMAATSEATVDGNTQSAAARGNDHTGTLTDGAGLGAGIVAVQRGDATSTVRSDLGGATTLTVQRADDSTLNLDSNRQQSVASGNGAALTLDVTNPTRTAGDDPDATRVIAGGDASVSAGSVIATQQTWSGSAKARIGTVAAPAGFSSLAGTLTDSTATAHANVLAAAAVANQAVTNHSVGATAADGTGAIATSLTVQDADGPVAAGIIGGTTMSVAGAIDHSSLSASDNQADAHATGNSSDALLDGHDILSTSRGPGSVWVSPDAKTGTSGSYTLHTEQKSSGDSIAATVAQGASNLTVDGIVDTSRITVTGNSQAADAVANDAKSQLDLDATAFGGSAVVGLFQANDANVRSAVGELDNRAGATIAPRARLQDSSLEIRDNVLAAQSIGNRGTNVVNASAADLSSMPEVVGRGLFGAPAARVGSLDNGSGVSASVALGSFQKTGELGADPIISSEILGQFAVTGDAGTDGTWIDISGNRQRAESTANTVDNSLRLTAAVREGAGAALYASQYGEATVSATSYMKVVAHGALENSASNIAGNTNIALATMNDAANRLDIDVAGTGNAGAALLDADPLGGATGEGEDLLVSTQFATGSVVANAFTRLATFPGDRSLGAWGPTDSRIAIAGNVTGAQATANQAVNQAVLNSIGGSGLANSQMSLASVSASASTPTTVGVASVGGTILASDLSVSDNVTSALARGNVAENSMTLDRFGAATPASVDVDRFETSVEAPVALVNVQANYGAISATADGAMSRMPLNAGVPVESSRISVSGNAMSATAYGNGAANTIVPSMGGAMGVALVSQQTNYGPVTARVIAPAATVSPGDVVRSSLRIVNNSVSAWATGNFVTNSIGTLR
ncbi:MAG: hypothetical protein JWR80_8601 [Bradyrhizobium sp.]|nr:hypothetical protein [Bradyrhizobium sp.]